MASAARFWREARSPVASARSFDLPLRLTARFRSLKTGTERETTGWSWRRNGARFLVAGFAALTRTSRSLSAGRRLWNVVLAWRSAPGRETRAWSKERFSFAIEPRAIFAFWVSEDRSERRSATEETTLAPL